MRLLVTGASGYLGWHLVRYLAACGHQVLGCWASREVRFPDAESARLDVRDADACRALVNQWRATHIIHAGAMTKTDECERDPNAAQAVNVDGTRHLLEAAERADSHFTLVSTDLVFDGRRPGGMYPVEEQGGPDEPRPVMEYGRTKLAAERIVRDYMARGGAAAVVRSALIYGPPGAPRPCFLEWLLRNIREARGAVFTDEYRSPVFVGDLCRLLERVATRRATGLWHASGPERLSRYEFALLAADAAGLPRERVIGRRQADVALDAPRPADVSLDISATCAAFDWHPLPCRDGLRVALSELSGA
ncbi:MAG: SDR family oxidoreductase [Candidatus Sumerlaeaceae bacterium]|nr:SDR family oxidoreductase [Candidatus Sumerlaeaceae bacterium]